MDYHKRSIFDWLTVGAAWSGVVISSLLAYHQYELSQLRPELEFGQFGACYRTDSQPDELVYWRLMLSNGGSVAAKDVYLNLVDVPEDARLWSSVAYTIEARTKDTLLIKVAVVPPHYCTYFALQPFSRRGQKLMPYLREQYYDGGRIKENVEWDRAVEYAVFEKLARTKGFISGVKGNHRNWEVPITADDIEIGKHMLTIEDR